MTIARSSSDFGNSGTAIAIELFDGFENVRFQSWMPGKTIMIENVRGLEALVLAGSLSIGDQTLRSQSSACRWRSAARRLLSRRREGLGRTRAPLP
jgi:hypothetical protein